MTPLDVGEWNLDVITIVFVGLVLAVPFQILVDWWGNRRSRKRRARTHENAAQPSEED